ncbi:unnamed protein product [Urochloa decumbens]|uniref:Uncharacterized protein n=1 Tax=Urochloa decumbens TaxID=240449 RepID=A0ABC8VZH5_9POAL
MDEMAQAWSCQRRRSPRGRTAPWLSPELDISPRLYPCRCGISNPFELVRRVVVGLDVHKREIVQSIGFGPMLEFPLISGDHSSFGLWLLALFDEETSKIVIDRNLALDVSETSVGDMFGIPAEGIDVRSIRVTSVERVVEIVSRYLRRGEGFGCVLDDARRVLEDRSPGGMSVSVDAIRVAAVIFFMGHVLAPAHSHGYDFPITRMMGCTLLLQALVVDWNSESRGEQAQSARIVNVCAETLRAAMLAMVKRCEMTSGVGSQQVSKTSADSTEGECNKGTPMSMYDAARDLSNVAVSADRESIRKMVLVAMKEHNARTLARVRSTLEEEGAKFMSALTGILADGSQCWPSGSVFTTPVGAHPTAAGTGTPSKSNQSCNKRRQVSFSPCVKLHFSDGKTASQPVRSEGDARPLCSTIGTQRVSPEIVDADTDTFPKQCSQVVPGCLEKRTMPDCSSIMSPFAVNKARAKETLILREAKIARGIDDMDFDVLTVKVPERRMLSTSAKTCVMAADEQLDSTLTRDQFIGGAIPYAVPDCRMVFMPCYLSEGWCCYAWDLVNGVCNIFDPRGRDLNVSGVTHRIFSWKESPVPQKCSGIAVVHFMRNFDGDRLVTKFEEESVRGHYAQVLFDLLNMKGNEACIPYTGAPMTVVGLVKKEPGVMAREDH